MAQELGQRRFLETKAIDERSAWRWWASDETAARMEAALKMTPEEVSLMQVDPQTPAFALAVPRFWHNMEALMKLSPSKMPTLWQVQRSKRGRAFCGFYDASGRGFGATLQIGDDLLHCCGQWSSKVFEDLSSNWRELGNLAMALENQVVQNGLRDCESFLFADNATAEAALVTMMSSA